MNTYKKEYELLSEKIDLQGLNINKVKSALKAQVIETPSWGYANSGTRFQAFPWPGAAVTTTDKLNDAAMVHKMTG
ncbi:MAG: hypothetical protein MUO42_08580, partial [Anaerolineaceae bacterium]|nr:hypothetical protein [Anaerolineaceae bacterium]